MSWRAFVFSLLGLVLLLGFAWFERSRPSSRVIALVAALAALAVAGRLIFTPIPNVVATTDIVLITGYAIGAAPGFAVGALAALVSNFWLGQGPWTPWQMAGWGLVGIGGAALAMLTGRRLGALGLATACALAGFAYGALLDLSVMVNLGGEQSFDRWLALSGPGLPFNVLHAAGNFAIALAAGPALVRMLLRYRSRLEVVWREVPVAPLALIAVIPLVALGGPADARAAAGPQAAAAWLARAQNADGGFGTSPGSSSGPAMTGWACLGLEAAGRNPLDVTSGGRSPIDFLRSEAGAIASTGDLERTILVLEAAGLDARGFAGRDLVAELRSRRSQNGSFEGKVGLTAFAILAQRATGIPASELGAPAAWLREAQGDDGGWGFQAGAPSDADSTGAALQGLRAAGGGGTAISRGVSYLREAQLRDGGFPLASGGASNSQSTAWAVQGLVAAGVGPGGVRTAGRSPLDYLAARQAGDGHYRYSSASDQTPVWVTGQALLAVSQKAFPLGVVPRAPAVGGTAGGGAAGSAGAGRDEQDEPARRKPRDHRRDQSRKTGRGGGGAAGPRRAERVAGELAGESDDGGGVGSEEYVGAGLGALAAALGGGFFWYRRRLG